MPRKHTHRVDSTAVEAIIGYTFSDKGLLEQALTHRSFLNEHTATSHNERLEFLGDAVLQLVATRELYDQYPDEPEGKLSLYRSNIVRTEFLADRAEELELHLHLRASTGQEREVKKGGIRSLLANITEAVIGAIYRDGGFAPANTFILTHVLTDITSFLASTATQDPKTTFQELVQREQQVTPEYTLTAATGPDNDRLFTLGVSVKGAIIAEGTGKSKQEAAQKAAQKALDEYQKDDK